MFFLNKFKLFFIYLKCGLYIILLYHQNIIFSKKKMAIIDIKYTILAHISSLFIVFLITLIHFFRLEMTIPSWVYLLAWGFMYLVTFFPLALSAPSISYHRYLWDIYTWIIFLVISFLFVTVFFCVNIFLITPPKPRIIVLFSFAISTILFRISFRVFWADILKLYPDKPLPEKKKV